MSWVQAWSSMLLDIPETMIWVYIYTLPFMPPLNSVFDITLSSIPFSPGGQMVLLTG